ncbi:MAG: DUF624 domain-containing protein [Defluviitaleaceae bacterium]|nr:DUF624 domain-containing protein [Defluviitaleaceae bacterium]
MKDGNSFADIVAYVFRYIFLFSAISMCFVLFSTPAVLVLFVPLSIITFFLYIFAFATLGPSFGAGLACMISIIGKKGNTEHLEPFSQYFELYKKNFVSTVKIWLPFCTIMTALISLVALGQIQWLLLAVFCTVIITTTTIINVRFNFKVVDIIKLGFYFTIKKWSITLAYIAIFAVSSVLFLSVGWLLTVLFNSIVFYAIARVSMPILSEIEENFLEKSQEEGD